MFFLGDGDQPLLQIGIQLVDAVHDKAVVADLIQEGASVPEDVAGIETQQESASIWRAEMHQRCQVVFSETRFAANKHRSMLSIACGSPDGMPQAFGIATGAHDAAVGPSHDKGSKPLQAFNGIRHG